MTPRARLTWFAHLYKALAKKYHRDQEPFFKTIIPRDGVVIDVGAHAGQYARMFADIAADGQVLSFEPGSYARSILKRAVWRHRNISIFPCALGRAPAELILRMPVKKSGSYGYGLSHTGKISQQATGRYLEETVPVVTLDSVVREQGLQRVDFIKADIEGAEFEMLAGAQETLRRFQPVLFIEFTAEMLARFDTTMDEAWAFLQSFGYVMSQMRHDGHGSLSLIELKEPRDGDLLCWQPEKTNLSFS